MLSLKIEDIQTWLFENKGTYEKIETQGFCPLEDGIYDMYLQLSECLKYYSLKQECVEALQNLRIVLSNDFTQIKNWVLQHEILGAEKLLMF